MGVLNGVQLTSRPGQSTFRWARVYEGVIVGYTPEGVPVVDSLALIPQSAHFGAATVVEAPCAGAR